MRARKATVFKDSRKKVPWIVRWLDWDADDKRVRRSRAFPRQRDAITFASDKTKELCGETKVVKPDPVGGLGDTPLGVFVDRYIERRKSNGDVRAATLDMWQDNLSRLVNHFGAGCAIDVVTTDGLSEFLAEQRMVVKKRKGQPLAKSSRNGIRRDVRTMFAYAKELKYIAESPMDGIRALKVNKDDKRGWHYFNPQDIQSVIGKAQTIREKAVFAMLYGTGLRFGELFALHPNAVDLDAGYVHVRPREATDDTPPFRIKDHECRSIPVPEFVAKLVNELKATLPKKHPYLFLSPERCERVREVWQAIRAKGGEWQNRMMVNNVRRQLKGYVTKAEIKLNGPVTVHCLRKSYGKNGARCMSADVLKEYMGHSKIATTLEFYSKRDDADDVHARWALDALMKGEPVQDLSLSDAKVTSSDQEKQNRKVG